MATMSTVMISSDARSQFGVGAQPVGPRLVTAPRGVASASTKEFDPFRLDTINQCLWRRNDEGRSDSSNEERILLTPKVFAILRYLVDHAGRLVTQDELLDAVWSDTHVQPEVLKRHIFEIRAILGDDPKNPTYIETQSRRGYHFIAAVRNSGSAEPTVANIPAGPRIVGRDQTLHELRAHLGRAIGGQRQIVFVTGEAGIGKTTVVDEFQRQAAQDASILIARGQCVEGYGGKEAYYPVLDALGNLCRGPEGASVVQILAAQAPTWLVQFPALLTHQQRETLQREIEGATRQRMLREIGVALETITSERPLVLVLEDLNWADPSTADLISALARARGTAKLMIIGTYRPADVALPNHPLKAVKQDLSVHQLCHEMPLEPLREEDIAMYLAGESPDGSVPEGLAALLHRRSEGNPLFMVAALNHMTQRGFVSHENGTWKLYVALEEIDHEVPENLRQMIEARIERLSEEERRALEVASICGVSFSSAVSASAANMDVESFENVCEGLSRRRQKVRSAESQQFPDGTASSRYEFVHALYREVLYRMQSPGRRAKLHLLVAETLETLHAHRPGEAAAELSHHFEQAGDLLRATKYKSLVAAKIGSGYSTRIAAASA